MDNIFGGAAAIHKLIKELEEMYPVHTPTPADCDRSIMYRAGQRSVVEYLIGKIKDV